MNTVSRMEIADCIEGAFGEQLVSRSDLIEFAGDHGARNGVLQVLARLERPAYRDLRELWSELADVPVELPT